MAFEQTIARLKNYQDDTRILNGLIMVGKEAVRRCPLDSGKLRASMQITGSRGVWGIGFTAPYAVFVHEILHYHHPVGEAKFLENAWNAKKNEFLDMLFD